MCAQSFGLRSVKPHVESHTHTHTHTASSTHAQVDRLVIPMNKKTYVHTKIDCLLSGLEERDYEDTHKRMNVESYLFYL
jgi:hypothetical protein